MLSCEKQQTQVRQRLFFFCVADRQPDVQISVPAWEDEGKLGSNGRAKLAPNCTSAQQLLLLLLLWDSLCRSKTTEYKLGTLIDVDIYCYPGQYNIYYIFCRELLELSGSDQEFAREVASKYYVIIQSIIR